MVPPKMRTHGDGWHPVPVVSQSDLDQSIWRRRLATYLVMKWEPISTAPFDLNLELAVFDKNGATHALVFPCRRILGGWINSATKQRIEVYPTHWREWQEPS